MVQEERLLWVVWVHEVALSWISWWIVVSSSGSRDWVSASWVVVIVIVDAWTPDSAVLGFVVWVVVEIRGFGNL